MLIVIYIVQWLRQELRRSKFYNMCLI